MNAFLRYLIAIGIGIGGTLAWQAHGEVAKHMAADWAAQHGWSLAWLLDGTGAKSSRVAGPTMAADPPAEPVIQAAAPKQTAPVAAPEPVVPTTPLDPAKLEAITASLAVMREKVEQIAAGQEQMASDIAKLKAGEQEIRQRISTATARPPVAAASKPSPSPAPPARPPLPLH
jgi:hypothetical protein